MATYASMNADDIHPLDQINHTLSPKLKIRIQEYQQLNRRWFNIIGDLNILYMRQGSLQRNFEPAEKLQSFRHYLSFC